MCIRDSPNARIAGVFGVAAAFLILSYYSVIGGWIIKYIVSYGTTFHAPEDFEAFISAPAEPVFWHFLFLFMTTAVCYLSLIHIYPPPWYSMTAPLTAVTGKMKS